MFLTMPGTKKSCARPVNSAMPAPSAMPSSPDTACVSGSRATSRQTVKTTDGTRAASTLRGTSWVKAQTTEKTDIGRIDSANPRLPPITACSVNCSATASARPPRRGAAGSAMRAGYQLVARVEHRALPLGLGHHAVDAQPPSGLDAGDVPPAQPDHVEAAAAVVQLGLERGDAGTRAQGHRAERAADGRLPARREHGDRAPARLRGQLELLLGVHLALGCHEARQRLAPARLGIGAHGTRVRRCRRGG